MSLTSKFSIAIDECYTLEREVNSFHARLLSVYCTDNSTR